MMKDINQKFGRNIRVGVKKSDFSLAETKKMSNFAALTYEKRSGLTGFDSGLRVVCKHAELRLCTP